MKTAATAACLAVLFGCHARYLPAPSEPRSTELDEQLLDLDHELHSLGAVAAPDCARQCDLQDRICDLSARICALGEKYPAEESIPQRCTDGKERCERARSTAARQCSCSR